MEDNYLVQLSEALEKSGQERRTKQSNARDAILRAEARVPLTEQALEVIQRVNRLQELINLGGNFSQGIDEKDATDLENAVVVLRVYLNSLEIYSNGLDGPPPPF